MLVNIEMAAKFLESSVKDFADIAVVGVSGGIDSAVTASVCVGALGVENVYLVSMPYGEIDRNVFNQRSDELANKLGAHHLVVPVGSATKALLAEFKPALNDTVGSAVNLNKLTKGNTRARLRMSVLYALAGELSYRLGQMERGRIVTGDPVIAGLNDVHSKTKRVRVIGTGNASEDLIGYDTKGGDALADLFVLGDLFKSEVYQLANYYEVPGSIVEAQPTAGLYDGQTDEAELGYTYEQLEPALSALQRCLSKGVSDSEINVSLEEFAEVSAATAHFVISRYLTNAHKHRAPEVVMIRNTDLVKDLWSR